MKISCAVIRDLLPLFYDKVCSSDSSDLIEQHLVECSKCKKELDDFQMDLENIRTSEGDKIIMKRISDKWTRDKNKAFAKGSMVVSALAAIICFIAFNIIGSEVLPDGTLVEPFALIPIGYVFILILIISSIVYFIQSRKLKNE